MKEKIQPIIDDLKVLFEEGLKEENYELCDALKGYLESFKRFMDDEIEYEDILSDVLEVCVQRYEILKTTVIEKNRYALFSAFGNWMFFWVDTTDNKTPLWDEIIEAQKKQERDIMIEMERFHSLPASQEQK